MEKIKELREKTGAGIADCKKALDETGGDIEKAVELLRKKGIAKAAKRSDRETSEGIIMVATSSDNNEGYVVRLSSETDFVSRNDTFRQYASDIIGLAKDKRAASLEELLALPYKTGTVKEEVDNLSGVIGEKIEVSGYAILQGQTVSAYSHMGGKIGVLVALSKSGVSEIATDIAMQIAATNPSYLTPEEVPAELIAKEKEIYREQLAKEGKPENIIENILTGKINKFFEEVCLVKQEFIKDDKKSVENVLGDVKIEKFIRFSL